MTPSEIRDIAIKRFNEMAPTKYNKGQREHGGILTDRDVWADMEQEVIDMWFYIQAAKIKLNKH